MFGWFQKEQEYVQPAGPTRRELRYARIAEQQAKVAAYQQAWDLPSTYHVTDEMANNAHLAPSHFILRDFAIQQQTERDAQEQAARNAEGQMLLRQIAQAQRTLADMQAQQDETEYADRPERDVMSHLKTMADAKAAQQRLEKGKKSFNRTMTILGAFAGYEFAKKMRNHTL